MSELLKDLEYALSLKRPHMGNGVHKLCSYIVDRIGDKYQFVDFCGNIHVDLRTDPRHQTLFTAHVDTVHREDGVNYFKQNGDFLHASGSVLGADDGAGVAILLHLIDNCIPGYYIFFQGEEKGGIGSRYLASNDFELLCDFQRAIAFDRKDVFSVITHQGYGRCASDKFANALADELNDITPSFMYVPDDTGIYTDTAEFTHIIPECTNISVGYFNEHTQNEKLDLRHLSDLAETLVKVNWDELPVERDPAIVEEKTYYYDYSNYNQAKTTKLTEKDLTDLNEEAEALTLCDALEKALEGRFNEVIKLVSEYTYPEDPSIVEKSMRTKYLTKGVLNELIDMLDRGNPVDAVYEALFDYATTGEAFYDRY